MPELISRAGAAACRNFEAYFTIRLQNENTRRAYRQAFSELSHWAIERGYRLRALDSKHLEKYLQHRNHDLGASSRKVHLAAIRGVFASLSAGGLIRQNPAWGLRVRQPAEPAKRAPLLSPDDVRQLFNSVQTTTIAGLRDRALLAVMIFACARVSAAISMDRADYRKNGKRRIVRLSEHGGADWEVPAHRQVVQFLEQYIAEFEKSHALRGPLFRTTHGRSQSLSPNRMTRVDVFRMVKRRVAEANLPRDINCHSLRRTGIASFLQNGGGLTTAMALARNRSIANTVPYIHCEPQATQVEARLTQADIDRIAI